MFYEDNNRVLGRCPTSQCCIGLMYIYIYIEGYKTWNSNNNKDNDCKSLVHGGT